MTPLMFAIGAFIGLATTMITAGISQYQADQQEELQKEANKIAETNVNNNLEIANQNFGLEKQQFEYQKQLNELQMKREDTAMQRQVADLKAAGLSPLMASGGASTGQLISGTAPHLDMSGVNSAISNLLGIKQDYASRKQMAYQFERQNHLQMAQQFADLTSLRLDNEYKKQLIEGQKIANDYNTIHGIRDPNFQTAIVDALQQISENRNITPDSVANVVEEKINQAKETINTSSEKTKKIIKNIAEDVTDNFKSIPEAANELNNRLSENKEKLKTSRNRVVNWYNSAKNWVKKKLGK